MISKDKTKKQKDIDDVLSSIDSLLDTARDVEADDLPVLKVESEASKPKEKITRPIISQKLSPNKKKSNKNITTRKKVTSKNKQTIKKEPVVTTLEKIELNQPVVEKADTEKKTITKTKVESKLQAEKEVPLTDKHESKSNNSTDQADLSLTQKELPVLDEIITEEEMALIAAGKELPKRVITEKFIPKTTADKIIDTMAIQLAEYNVTRLEYEYLHELIDEILTEDKIKKS